MANDIVERLHRTLRASFKPGGNLFHRSIQHPVMLSGLRATSKEDIGCGPDQISYDVRLHPSDEFIDSSDYYLIANSATHATQITKAIRTLQAKPRRLQQCQSPYVSNELDRCPLVYSSIVKRIASLSSTLTTAPFESLSVTKSIGFSKRTKIHRLNRLSEAVHSSHPF